MAKPPIPELDLTDEERGLTDRTLERGRDILDLYADPKFQGLAEESFPEENIFQRGGRVVAPKIKRDGSLHYPSPPGSRPEPLKTRIGKLAHEHAEELIPESELPRGLKREVPKYVRDTTESGRPVYKIDRFDEKNRIVYEIKPKGEYWRLEGEKQARNYARVLSEESGKKWGYKVVQYDPDEAVTYLSDKYKLTPEEIQEYKDIVGSRRSSSRAQRQSVRQGKEQAAREEGAAPWGQASKKERATGDRGLEPAEKEGPAGVRNNGRPAQEDSVGDRGIGDRARSRSAAPEEKGLAKEETARQRRSPRPSSRGFALGGVLYSVVIGALGVFATKKLRVDFIDDLSRLSPPPLDFKSALEYLSDPETSQRVRALDALDKDWRGASFTIRQVSNRFSAITAAEQNRLLVADPRPLPDRLADLDYLISDMNAFAELLHTVLSNLDEVLRLESQFAATAENADALERLIHDFGYAGIAAGVLDFHPADLNKVELFFRHLKVACREIPPEIRSLRATVSDFSEEWDRNTSELSSARLGLTYEDFVRRAGGGASPVP